MKKMLPLILFLITLGCIEPEEIKSIEWNGNKIKWTVLNGGPTTSFLWKVYFTEKNSNKENLIFESYSTPYVTDISVRGDYLLIHCYGEKNKNEYIVLNLTMIDEFTDNPIEYFDCELKQTNDAYYEPEFVKREREETRRINKAQAQ